MFQILILLALILVIVFLFISLLSEKKKNKEAHVNFETSKAEKENYKTITQKANDVIIVIDIINGRILQANKQAADVLGYSYEDFLKKSIFDLHPKELLNESSKIIADVWEKKGLVYQNIPFQTASNELLQVECSAKVLDYNGSPSIVIYARDITERIKLQNQIKQDALVIEEKNHHILSSINYALRIQQAILPDSSYLESILSNHFIYYLPKDIVSGDFYWIEKENDKLYLAAIDCTGHGVPGAFLTMLAGSNLDRALYEYNILKPSVILDKLNELIKMLLQSKESVIRDGMDISLCMVDEAEKIIEFAGANNPLYIIRKNGLPTPEIAKVHAGEKNSLLEIKGDRMPIGKSAKVSKFTNHRLEYFPGDRIYLFSDGFTDQFGGEHYRKFMTKRFRNLLLETSNLSLTEQKGIIDTAFVKWKGKGSQVDDICIIGVELS